MNRKVAALLVLALAFPISCRKRQAAAPEHPASRPATEDTTTTATVAKAGGTDGHFPGDLPIPGQTEDFGSDNFALEATAFLDLPAGVVRFGVNCDDGYKLASAAAPNATTPPLAFHNGGPADETFDVVVTQAGTYAFRLVWYETGGGAHVEWFTVNRTTGDRTLVNAPGGIVSHTSASAAATFHLLSSGTVAGTYLAVAGETVNSTAKTITAPLGGATAFFRVASETVVLITQIELVGGNVVIHYQ